MDRKEKPKPQDEFGLNVGDYVIVTLIEPLSIGPSDSEYIIGAKIDSGSIEIVNLDVTSSGKSKKQSTKKYKDYNIGIIFDKGYPEEPGKGRFIPRETSLRIFKKGHKCPTDCSAYIRARKSSKYKLTGQKRFKICRSHEDNTKLEQIQMVALVDSIDNSKKYIDLTIGPVYSLMKKC